MNQSAKIEMNKPEEINKQEYFFNLLSGNIMSIIAQDKEIRDLYINICCVKNKITNIIGMSSNR